MRYKELHVYMYVQMIGLNWLGRDTYNTIV